jgi:hypothetical protein
MAKVFGFRAKAAVPVAACFLAASLVSVARAGNIAQLTGHWNFNLDQSDDAEQKVQDARQSSKIRANSGGGGNYPDSGGGYPGTGGTYPSGGMGRGGMGGMGGGVGGMGGGMGRGGRQGTQNNGGISPEDWDNLAANPKYLLIDQHSDQVVITDDSDHAQTFYPDGKKHDDKDPDGRKISTKASWEGDAFIAETKLPHSEKLTRTLRLSDDGKQLYVITRFEAPSLAAPVSIRRVYDVGKAPTK